MLLSGKELIEARKARGVTQSQLADEMGVSRQTVSRWENGSTQPDEAMQKRLAVFFSPEKEEGSVAISSVPSQEPAAKAEARRLPASRIPLMVVCTLLLAAVILYGTTRPPASSFPTSASGSEKSDVPFLPTVHSMEVYQQPAVNEAGKPCLLLTPDQSPVSLLKRPDMDAGYVWDIRFSVHEINGFPFTLTKFSEVFFNSEQEVSFSRVHSAEECADFFMSPQLPAGFEQDYNCYHAVCGDIAYAASLEGTDENGSELEFRVWIPLSQEVAEALTPDAFLPSADRQAGAAYIELIPESHPIELIEDPAFEGDRGWSMAFLLKNTGESDFTPSAMVWALFCDDLLCNTWTDDAAFFAEYLPDGVLAIGSEPLGVGSGAALQPLTHVGIKLTGTDAAGNELSFTTLVPLAQE